MAVSRAEARSRISELAAAFNRNREHYLSADYDEAKLRSEYLDPFFVALGWDVRNERHRIGDDCEVVVEDRTKVRGHRRRPDYGFRIARELKFFVEAKRPSLSIDDADAAFQIKTSAWASEAPLGVLTNFDRLRGFDGLVEPRKDAPEAGMLPDLELSVDAYLERFDDLFDTLSRDAVAEGNLDRFLERERKARKGARRAEVLRPMDDAFLATLEKWREELAAELALRNHFDSAEALAAATQRILDRIVFLRVCEDRDIEPRDLLQSTLTEVREDRRRALYPALVKLFRRLAPQYNGTLFAEHPSEKLRVEKDEVLARIIDGMHDPAPYRFDFVRPDFLGSVYERFLGSTLRLTAAGRAKVEEKPEVRHAGGVYYTPRYIVDAIVEGTLGPLVAGKTPEEMLELRVVDPACGSGSFLLAAFQYLVEKHEAYYLANLKKLPKKSRENFIVRDGTPRLTLRRKQEILTRCIFGVDLDAQAVEVAQMSLYLQLLAGERDDTLSPQMELRATYLPALVDNIRRGNSLLTSRDLTAQKDWTQAGDLHPFDWRSTSDGFGRIFEKGGFDAVIGNPPYIRIQELAKWAPREAALYKEKFVAAKKGNFDIYVLFIEQAMSLARSEGRVGFILPHKFFQAKYGEGIRKLLAEKNAVSGVVDFGHAQVFEGATTYTCLLFLRPGGAQELKVRRIEEGEDLSRQLQQALAKEPETLPIAALAKPTWDFGAGTDKLAARLLEMRPTLGDVCERIFQGLKTGADPVFVVDLKSSRDALAVCFSRSLGEETVIESAILHPLLKGGEMKRYGLLPTRRAILFPYERGNGGMRLIPADRLATEFPKTWEYLERNKRSLEAREHGRWRGPAWYQYSRSQALDVVSRPKLLTADIVERTSFSLDESGSFFFLGGAAGGYGLLPSDPEITLPLIAILNSTLFDWLTRPPRLSTPFRGGWFSCEARFIKHLPIRIPEQIAERESLARLASEAIEAHRPPNGERPQGASATPPPIERIEREIDDRVYRLYGIGDDERRRIEAELHPEASARSTEDPLERLRALLPPWTGPVPTYEEMKQARRELWTGYVEGEEPPDD